jgi:hypothetical protein
LLASLHEAIIASQLRVCARAIIDACINCCNMLDHCHSSRRNLTGVAVRIST